MDFDRPLQVGKAVYQMAKLQVLQFYYDCLNKFVDRRDFELIQMDTDRQYFPSSCVFLEEAERPRLRDEFQTCPKEWFSWNK